VESIPNTKKEPIISSNKKLGKGERPPLEREKEKEKEKQRKKLTKKCMIENNNLYKTSADAYNPQLDW
jgi:hypothetical protein